MVGFPLGHKISIKMTNETPISGRKDPFPGYKGPCHVTGATSLVTWAPLGGPSCQATDASFLGHKDPMYYVGSQRAPYQATKTPPLNHKGLLYERVLLWATKHLSDHKGL